jgi:serine/threonine protein kinase
MPEDFLTGRQLANFRLERLLGRGGMGEVYYGWDLTLERPAAVKVIDARFRADPAYLQRFLAEARAVAAWRHPNIVQVYYAGEQDGLYFYAMEYIEGESLSQLMQRYNNSQARLPYAAVLHLGQAIASALDYAHSRGVIHRDVKPANVLVARDGRAVLTDFGLALDLARGSLGEVFGSAHYVAPEQARRSAEAVPQSDLYSLGVVLYELLTGAVPFDDPSPTAVAVQHLTQAPPPPRQKNPALPAAAEAVLLKALSKAPSERYPTGAALLAALEAALASAEAPAAEPSAPAEPPAAALPLPPPPPIAAGNGAVPGPDPLVGQQLGDYHIERLLGRGGMARVYLGRDQRLNRPAAIKVIDPFYRSEPDYLARFEREAQAIACLQHPNIVRLYHAGEAGGQLYLALEYLPGQTLAERLAAARPGELALPPEQLLRLTQELGAALDAMHAAGIIHRDLTPANIILAPDGHAVVTDFGLAFFTQVGSLGQAFGSPHYIAPEQAISSAKAVPQSDIYALGVILYELCTGQRPFEAAAPLEAALQHLSAAPRPPRQLNPALNPATEAVLLKALAKEPAARYASGAELYQALAAALNAPPATGDGAAAGPTAERAAPTPPAEEAAEPPAAPVSIWKRYEWAWRVARILALLLAVLLLARWTGYWPFKGAAPRPSATFAQPAPTQTRLAALPPSATPSAPPMASPTAIFTTSVIPSATPSLTLTPAESPTPGPPTGTPTATLPPSPTSTVTSTPTPSASPTTSATPTPTPTPTVTLTPIPTLTYTPLPTPTATLTPTTTPVVITVRTTDRMPMALIPGGSFPMGAAQSDLSAEFDERPQHFVTLNSFYIDQFEVSVAQYAAFLNTLGQHGPGACLGSTCARTRLETVNSHLLWDGAATYQAEAGFENYPVNNITWFGAAAYCQWVGGRLPTEAEWELAGRGWAGWLYPWGESAPDATRAVFGKTAFSALLPVDALPDGASIFGVYGLAGGVWEWVNDYYSATYYNSSPPANPTGPAGAYRDPHVLRGGSWKSPAFDLRSSARKGADPLDFKQFGEDTGFRCVRP